MENNKSDEIQELKKEIRHLRIWVMSLEILALVLAVSAINIYVRIGRIYDMLLSMMGFISNLGMDIRCILSLF